MKMMVRMWLVQDPIDSLSWPCKVESYELIQTIGNHCPLLMVIYFLAIGRTIFKIWGRTVLTGKNSCK